jgi:thioredoxin-disulfide reductase
MSKIYDSIIVGAGPAGITASIYASRKQMDIMVIGHEIGGQVTKTSVIENYTGYEEITGEDLAKKFHDHLKQFHFDFKHTQVISLKQEKDFFLVSTKEESFKTLSIILALGARPRLLNIKGEEELKNRGVTYCATCDAPLFFGKDVAVVGSGNSAFGTVLQLTSIANKIYLLMRSPNAKGDPILFDKIKNNPKVTIFYEHEILEIKGEKKVEEIVVKNGGAKKSIEVGGVFVNVGYSPNTDIAEGFLELNNRKEIIINDNNETSISGIFAAGDCTSVPFKQIIIASGEGAKAAISNFNYLSHIETKF